VPSIGPGGECLRRQIRACSEHRQRRAFVCCVMPSMATNSRRQTGMPKTRPSRRWHCAGISCLLLVLIVGCSSKEEQMIDPTDLQNIKLGQVVHLSGMLKKPAEAVCVLTAYRDRLDDNEPLSRQVNAHLAAMNFTPIRRSLGVGLRQW